MKKVILTSILFVYTVLCGIIIADYGTSSVAGASRPLITDRLILPVQRVGESVGQLFSR